MWRAYLSSSSGLKLSLSRIVSSAWLWPVIAFYDKDVGLRRAAAQRHGHLIFGRRITGEGVRVARELDYHIARPRFTFHALERPATYQEARTVLGERSAILGDVALVGVRVEDIGPHD